MRKKSNKALKTIVISSILALVLILSVLQLAGVLNLNPFAVSDYHTGISPSSINYMNTEHKWQDCWHGQAVPGTGYPNQEMLPDTKYVTSFSRATGDDALSERINIQGNLYENEWVELCSVSKAYYNVYVRTDPSSATWEQIVGFGWSDPAKVVVVGGTGWRTANYNPVGGAEQEIWISSMEIRLIGSIVGALKVEAVWHFSTLFSNWDKTMSIDYAYLASGEGRINIEGHSQFDTPMYEIGDAVRIFVSADYSGATASGTGSWQLWAFPMRGGQGRMLNEWTDEYFREIYEWILPADAWVRGSSNSQWTLELHNTLFSTDYVMINTIDIKANAPPTPTILTSPEVPQVGEDILVTMSANTNVNTNEKIVKFIVRAVYTDNNFQFYYNQNVLVDAGSADPYTASTTIHPPRAGQFRLQVFAHDFPSGRQSEIPGEKVIEMHEGKYRLTIFVKDAYDSMPIQGARVQKVGSGEIKYSEPDGECWFDLDQGSYEFQITKNGYRSESRSWTITDGNKEVEALLTRTTSTWDLTVTVKTADAETVWGATVKVAGTEKLTIEDGSVTFKDVAEGDYTITANKGTLSGKKDVTLDRTRDIDIIIREGGGYEGGDGIDYLWYIIGGIVVVVILFGVLYYMKLRKSRGTKKKKGPGLISIIFKGKKRK